MSDKVSSQDSRTLFSTLRSVIFNLADVPRPNGCKKLKGKEAYRIRVADYRVVYEIHDKILLKAALFLSKKTQRF
ncbi:type II toxin-antitoxin system RelE family toxin [Algoriphagus sp. C2-6-M1]|uniref:type II toxin-antitoxin system RelE family toxin n=1 Tax=Algoriphagus persicinus TaxID=3108754 RepID=UPI003A5CBE28